MDCDLYWRGGPLFSARPLGGRQADGLLADVVQHLLLHSGNNRHRHGAQRCELVRKQHLCNKAAGRRLVSSGMAAHLHVRVCGY